MRLVNEAGELIGLAPELEIIGDELRGLEATLGTLEPEELRGAEPRAIILTGPKGDPCGSPPTARALAKFKPSIEEIRALTVPLRLAGANLDVLSVDQYGAPSYGPLGKPEGFAFHTPENVDHTLAQAIAIARWQATASNTSGGSYSGLLGYNGTKPMSDPLGWTMVRSVPWNVCAGGIATYRDARWAPGRYPWIAALLSPAAYGDPNKYLQQISFSGKAAWWAAKTSTAAGIAEIRGALIAAARWIKILETSYSFDAVMTLHRHWQTDRSDPAGLNFADLILAEYEKLSAPVPAPDPTAAYKARIAKKDARFDAAGARVAELEANVRTDIAAIRAELVAGRRS